MHPLIWDDYLNIQPDVRLTIEYVRMYQLL